MLQTPRGKEESWVDYIKCATEKCEQLADIYGSKDWVELQRTRKWQLAGYAASSTDHRWTKRILDWKPWHRCIPYRRVGHPLKRWEDDFVAYIGEDWVTEASEDLWPILSGNCVFG